MRRSSSAAHPVARTLGSWSSAPPSCRCSVRARPASPGSCDAGQVDALSCVSAWIARSRVDVAVGVAAGIARRALGRAGPCARRCRRVCGCTPGELGGHADHVDRALVGAVASTALVRADRRVRRAIARPPMPRRQRARRFLRVAWQLAEQLLLRLDSFCGTSTLAVTSRSPWPFASGAPLPRTRKVLPLGVPAGTFSVTGPFRVGTCTCAPSAASGKVTGSVEREVVALAAEQRGAARTCTTHVEVARRGAWAAGLAAALSLIRCRRGRRPGSSREASRSAHTPRCRGTSCTGARRSAGAAASRTRSRHLRSIPWFTCDRPAPPHGRARAGRCPAPPRSRGSAGTAPGRRSGRARWCRPSRRRRTARRRSPGRRRGCCAGRRHGARPPNDPPNRSPRSPTSPDAGVREVLDADAARRRRRRPPGNPPAPNPDAAISRTWSYCLRLSSSPSTS